MAVRDADNYIVVWERWTDSTYSVVNATKPGQKIEAFFVMDNVPYQNKLSKLPLSGARMIFFPTVIDRVFDAMMHDARIQNAG